MTKHDPEVRARTLRAIDENPRMTNLQIGALISVEMGVDVSGTTVHRWRKEAGLPKAMKTLRVRPEEALCNDYNRHVRMMRPCGF